jgi:prepilin-type N-terminal cleavage/methylation domain-containing protein
MADPSFLVLRFHAPRVVCWGDPWDGERTNVISPWMRRVGRDARGFTVTELLVVIAIAGVIMALSVPTLWTYFRTAAMRAGAEEIVTVLNGGRQLAIRSNTTVCVTNDGTTVQLRVGGCAGPIWTGPGTDAAGNITLANGLRAGGTPNFCYSYLGAGTTAPAPCVNNAVFTVTDPAGGATMNVTVATTGRARIQ